jgi:hypothetical protein
LVGDGLALKKKPPSIQAGMAQNVEELSQEFKNVQLMMQQTLHKMNGEAWRTTTDASLGSLLTKTTKAVMRINVGGP